MVQITFVAHDGVEHTIDATVGGTVMLCAIDNEVPGIDADCGGGCACATCHVYVRDEWIERVGQSGALENSMLDMNPGRRCNSRLSCQIDVVPELDALVVDTPEFQY
ncbi:MAG: 2Fe-2S ferredoxin [Thiotrichales bacterium]|nr:2Fe-2S ferredoxin [Thiotrichales bacterium]